MCDCRIVRIFNKNFSNITPHRRAEEIKTVCPMCHSTTWAYHTVDYNTYYECSACHNCLTQFSLAEPGLIVKQEYYLEDNIIISLGNDFIVYDADPSISKSKLGVFPRFDFKSYEDLSNKIRTYISFS